MAVFRKRSTDAGAGRRIALPSSFKPGKLNEQRAFPADAGAFPEAKELLEQFGTAESAGSHAVKVGVSGNIEQILSAPGMRKLLKAPTETEAELQRIIAGDIPAPEAYPRTQRKGKEPPADFLRRVWSRFLADGCLSLDLLRAIDPSLVQALHNWDMYYHTDSACELLTKEKRVDSFVEGLPEYLVERIKWIGSTLVIRDRGRSYREKIRKEDGAD